VIFLIRFIVGLTLGLISSGCFAFDAKNGELLCSDRSLDDLYTSYVIYDVIKYRGGLTSEASAKAHVGEKVLVDLNAFQVRDVVIQDPSYEFACYPPQREGEISPNRWSDFYGFGLDREFIEVVHVYGKGDASEEVLINLEVRDSELWEMHDGWIYMMKPSRK